MTICAGFVYEGGVLLCSDSQVETPGQKGFANKLGTFVTESGGLAAAVAGNVDYGVAAFQTLERLCQEEGRGLSFAEIEETLTVFYQEHVFKHPGQGYERPDYVLLIASKPPDDDNVRLYVTNEATTREITASYRCIGSGQEVGHTVLKPLWKPRMDFKSTLHLAAYMLAIVKNNVPGCSGKSQFCDFGNFGFPSVMREPLDILHLENVCGWFGQMSSEFLLNHMCDSDEDFEKHLSALQAQARHLRVLWKEQFNLIARSRLSTPRADPLPLQPSQASPEGSDGP